ncbi:MAG: hypothetical protein WBN34_02995 [Woeseia sp.]
MLSIPVRFYSLLILVAALTADASPLFEEDSTLDVSLTGPLATLLDANDDTREFPFILQAGATEQPIQVRVRGKSRKRVCDFTPLRFDFPTDAMEGTAFADLSKLKFVSHCSDDEASQINAIEEYGVYKIFAVLSDASYKVRLLHVTYTDTDARLKEASFTRYGFVVEPSSALAARISATKVDAQGVVLSKLNPQQAATVYVFQYLVGNTDWSLVMANEDDKCCHNGDLFAAGDEIYLVPYDFDLVGLVNARYAKPDPTLRISSVTQRRYRGYCIDTGVLKEAVIAIKARKEEILNVIRSLPLLTQKDKASRLKYLEGFFAAAEDEDRLVKSFDRKCL